MLPPSSCRTLSPLKMITSSLLCILLATASYNSFVIAWSTSSPSSSSSLVVVSPSRTSLVPSASTRRAHYYGFNNRYQSIKLSSAILPLEEEKEKAEKEQLEQLLECSSCKRSFQTRNALFRKTFFLCRWLALSKHIFLLRFL